MSSLRHSDTNAASDAIWNRCQYDASSKNGHYESFFLRANHPFEPRAFWIRYTLFVPKGRPHEAIGEIWAIYFDGDKIVAAQEDHLFRECEIGSAQVNLKLGHNRLRRYRLEGSAARNDCRLSWDLEYDGRPDTLLFLPERFYSLPFPKAKGLVGVPHALFSGSLRVNGETIDIRNWPGSENHNWGVKHTDEYAWGQVSGFDNQADSFLEVATARIHLGPLRTPPMTLAVLRIGTREYRFNNLAQSIINDGSYRFDAEQDFAWTFCCKDGDRRLEGRISAPSGQFVGLRYKNPPGGSHTCLNCKIATADVILTEKGKTPLHLVSNSRAAFEILTDDVNHGVTLAND